MRTYGIEMEMIGINAEAAKAVVSAAGIRIEAESYNHTTKPWWKIVPDASLRDTTGRGSCEVVSPILAGEDGFAQIKKVCDALISAGATVNKTCGLHVHVGASDVTVEVMKRIINRYNRFEGVIDGFMPESRRGDYNEFSRSLNQYVSRIQNCQNIESIACNIPTRYTKVNVQSYLRHGTVEFRQHSGTVEAEKAINWVKFCLNFVEESMSATSSTSFTGRDTKSRIKALFAANPNTALSISYIREALDLTCKDCTIATYVADIQNPKYAGREGTVILAKVGGAYKMISSSSDSAFKGLSAELVAYYNARSARLSGRVVMIEDRMAA